jgi:L-asparagine transporter-like permease
MRYVTASIGALFIFAAVFILSAFMMPLLPSFLRQTVQVGGFYTNNIVGLVLSLLAAAASYRATLRHYAKRRPPARGS